MKIIECFKIQLLQCDDIFDIVEENVIKQILCDQIGGFHEPSTIVADPFLFVKDDTLFLFYEDKKMYKNGVISMISTKDLQNWSDPIVVLKETCHLSYPWVFEDAGHIYMIPETCGLKEIRLYEANNTNLSSFRFVTTIMRDENEYTAGFSFSDSSIYKRNSTYYLMTNINDGKDNILKLYYSKCLFEGYVEHPMSPICRSNKYGRNAGNVFDYNGKTYRVAQDCVKRYGDNVHLLEIKTMTELIYEEQIVKNNILPNNLDFYHEGGHQFNNIRYKDKYIVATDAKEYHYFVFNKIMHRMGIYKKFR